MSEIAGPVCADSRQAAELHKHCAIPIQNRNSPACRERHPEAHSTGTTHRADLIEVLRAVGECEELTATFPGSSDDCGVVWHSREKSFEQIGAGRAHAAAGKINTCSRRQWQACRLIQAVIAYAVLLHKECKRQIAFANRSLGHIERGHNLACFARKTAMRYLDH